MKFLLISLIKFYRMAISPYFPQSCRFTPTCSHYAMEAISRHGSGKGLILSIHRIFRCHPFSKGGHDPVP
ncbi:MAG: membrane protein insertion efficiency factor YidD [Bacteroidetes bacterium]|nr:membrane protein insertion efficiency factor YidD [Bacteroidota bacterium]